jgi:hypothetical protein
VQAVLEGSELYRAFKLYPLTFILTDGANNAIGLAVGANAMTFEEVVARARAAVLAGIEAGGTGARGTPR